MEFELTEECFDAGGEGAFSLEGEALLAGDRPLLKSVFSLQHQDCPAEDQAVCIPEQEDG